jgi:hypothetical protein
MSSSGPFYSQSKEDQILYEKFFKTYKQEGQKYFFEMGAIDGVLFNNTKFFEDSLGWKGLLVEGNPFVFPRLLLNRPNALCVNAVVSNLQEPINFRVCLNIPAVCSVASTQPKSFDDEYYRHSKMFDYQAVPTTLTTIVKNSALPRIDLAVLDVEGHEIHVLDSFDFENSIPIVSWMIETFDTLDDNNEIVKYMKAKNYKCMGNVAHNAFFVREDFVKLF